MFTKNFFSGVICSLFFVSLYTVPVMASDHKSGQDWYCSDPDTHKQYEKHLRQHLDQSSDIITEKLDKIYTNPDLSVDEKKAKALEILDKYLSRMKAGMGD